MFSNVSNLLKDSIEKYDKDADYTNVSKLF